MSEEIAAKYVERIQDEVFTSLFLF